MNKCKNCSHNKNNCCLELESNVYILSIYGLESGCDAHGYQDEEIEAEYEVRINPEFSCSNFKKK